MKNLKQISKYFIAFFISPIIFIIFLPFLITSGMTTGDCSFIMAKNSEPSDKAEIVYNYTVYFGKAYDASVISIFYKAEKSAGYVAAIVRPSEQEGFYETEFKSKLSETEILVQKDTHVVVQSEKIKEGTWTVYENGTIVKGQPQVQTYYKYTIYYESDWPQAFIQYKMDINDIDSPQVGPVEMEPSQFAGCFTTTFETYSSGTKISFTDGLSLRMPPQGSLNIESKTWTVLKDGTIKAGLPSSELKKLFTIYYKSDLEASNAYYRVKGKQWTRAPGVPMEESGYSGYKRVIIDFGRASSAEIAFNDGKGTWDNNHGKNYTIDYNDSNAVTIEESTIMKGEPVSAYGKIFVVYYKGDFSAPYAYYRVEGEAWTAEPGIQMEDSLFPGFKKIDIYLESSNKIEIAFNDGKGNWDRRAGLNYHFEYNATGAVTLINGKIKQGTPEIVKKE